MQPNNSDLTQNDPNDAMFSLAFSPTFGNVSFQIQPSQTGEVSNTFGTIPYLSLESLIYMQQMTAQVSPTNIVAGQNTGQQNIQGSYTIQDQNGLTRMVMGFEQNGF